MRWWNSFWKMRRQHGSVKTATMLFLAALFFIVQSIIDVSSYIGFVNQKTEYILRVSSPEGVQASDFTKLEKIEDAGSISRQREYSITYKRDAAENLLQVTELSADYLKSAYGIDTSSAETCFYLNEPAWEETKADEKTESFQMSYEKEDGTSGTARFVRASGLGNDAPMAYTVGNSISLAGCMNIRLLAGKTDITGTVPGKLQMLGYVLENEQDIQNGAHKLEITMLKLKYGLIIAALAASFGGVLVREAYRAEK